MASPPLNKPGRTPSGASIRIAVLSGAVLALVLASVYLLYQFNQIRDDVDHTRSELAQTRQQLLAEIAKVHEISTALTQTQQSTVESLKIELAEARRQARLAAGSTKLELNRRADALAARLEKINAEHAKTDQAVTDTVSQISQIKSDADATKAKVGEVSSEVGTVKTELKVTKTDLEKTIADLKTTKGDLGIESARIATNDRELAALKALGDRDITELKLGRERAPRKIGNVQIRLKSADPKKNRYTVVVIADDKTVEKANRTVNEPVQFLLLGSTQPYELVVNDVKKDMIVGYLSAPKSPPRRN